MSNYTDPRSFIESRPVSSISHKGLQIAARNVTVYTCNVPDRRTVAKENYLRRSRQISSCGYNSVKYRPYETVGKVYSDNKNMILVALGQDKDNTHNEVVDKAEKILGNKSTEHEPQNEEKDVDIKNTNVSAAEPQMQYLISPSNEKLENIQTHLAKGRKMINAVRLGCNLFHLIKKEQKRLADEAEMERQRKLDLSRRSMQIISPSSDSEDSSDEEEQLGTFKMNSNRDIDKTQHDKQDDCSSSQLTVNSVTTPSSLAAASRVENLQPPDSASMNSSTRACSEKLSPRLRRKLRSSIRPYSAVYSNINYPELGTKESLFRQLCALNWILDAMSQDVFPPVVLPLTNCWNIRELRLELRSSRKKVEKEKQTESNWQSFLVNPGRFSQQRDARKMLTRKISVHPQHLQRLSAVTSSSSTAGLLRTEPKSRRSSFASNAPDAYAATDITEDSESQYPTINEEKRRTTPTDNNKIEKNSEITREKTSEKRRENISILKNAAVSKSFTTIVNAAFEEERKLKSKRLSKRHLNQLTSSDSAEQLSTKTESRVNAWVRETGHQRHSKTKFITAALAAFGAIAVNNCVEKVPSELKKRFHEVSEENKIVLSDKLEVQNRKQWETVRRKFIGIDHSLHVHKALDKMRNDYSFIEPETTAEMQQRVSEECKWYKDLIDTFPERIKNDRYICFALNKIARFGSLEGRKTSGAHFLKIMATLRPWELCYPEIAAAVEFVRENIVELSAVEYDDWFSSQKSS